MSRDFSVSDAPQIRVKSFLTNHSAERSKKRIKTKKGTRKHPHPQHPQPDCRSDGYSTKMSLEPLRERAAIFPNIIIVLESHSKANPEEILSVYRRARSEKKQRFEYLSTWLVPPTLKVVEES